VEKPYLNRPIGWPVEGRTPYQIRNVSDKAVKVTAKVASTHKFFEIRTEPAELSIEAGRSARVDVVATVKPDKPPMTQETAQVWFVPDGDEALAYQTSTFCTAPLPKDCQRMVMYTPAEIATLKVDADAE